MERNGLLFFFLVLFIFLSNCSADESQVKELDPNTQIDPKISPSLNQSSISTQTNFNSELFLSQNETKVEDQSIETQRVSNERVNSNSSMESGLKKDPQVSMSTDDSNKESGVKEEDKKQGDEGIPKRKKGRKKRPSDETQVLPEPSRKDNGHAEECDSSNNCSDERNQLIACLRVAGNDDSDSPDYLLLIQNKGTSPLTVNISAPDYVQLEKDTLQLLAKEDNKVKLSIGKGSNDTLIILSAGKGQCRLDFHDLVTENSVKKTSNSKSSYTNVISQAPSILFISMAAAIFLLGSVLMYVKYRKRDVQPGDIPKYQKLETDLPVSGGAKVLEAAADGWDNSWGDDSWDDEEAPKTPSLPVTPSLSSKGLAPRRSTKDGWKD